MAGKVPVSTTIANAYRFAFGNIVNNLALIWMPVAILWALAYYYNAAYVAAILDAQSGDPDLQRRAFPFLCAAAAVVFVLATAQVAALTKEALGLRKGQALLQFPFGPSSWRLMGAYLMCGFVLILLSIACSLAARIGNDTLQAGLGHTPTAIALGTLAALLFILGASIYISVKMSFFLAPVAIAEHKASLIRAWELSKGNFWRLLAVVLAIVIPILLLSVAFAYAQMGDDAFPHVQARMTSAELAAFHHHQQEVARRAFELTERYWYVFYPLNLLLTVITYGLTAGSAAAAYRALFPAKDAG